MSHLGHRISALVDGELSAAERDRARLLAERLGVTLELAG